MVIEYIIEKTSPCLPLIIKHSPSGKINRKRHKQQKIFGDYVPSGYLT